MSDQSSNSRLKEFFSDLFTESGTPIRFAWQVIQAILILVSCLSMFLENFEAYRVSFADFISTLDLIVVAFLTVDYLGNLSFSYPRINYIFSFWGLVDLMSVLPFYLLLLEPSSAVIIKSLRALRFVRLLVVWRIAKARF